MAVVPVKVLAKRVIKTRPERVYDLTVADNHNLFVCSKISETPVLAHNCAMDVQSIWAVHQMQMATATAMKFQGKSYLEAYHRLVLVQMSNNIHGMYSMYVRGNPLDLKYQMYIASKRSPLMALIKEELDKLKSLPGAIKANDKLVSNSGAPKKGLFGKVKTPWVLNLDIVKHKETLFFDTLKLEPLRRNEESGRGSMDKWFQAEYKDVPEIKVLSRKNKLGVLRDTFAIGILNRMSEDPDARVDNRVRPSYGFADVVSGRSNSFKPSLQQIPERSAEAKIIKRSFIAEDGKIHIKMDYSSHEVRGWGFISNDTQVAASFIRINALIAKFRRKGQKTVPSPEDRATLKAKGDIHRINYSAFSGVPVLKVSDEQRQSAKEIVFGSIYGMSAASLAEKLGIEVEEAEELIAKFFSRAVKAKKWLDFTAEYAQKHYYAFSPLGRRRNLYANITGNRRIMGGCNRRAQNAPIQGMSSDFGFNAARLMEIAIFKTFRDLGRSIEDCATLSAGVMQMVHDSIKLECNYEDFFVILWIVEYCAVYGLRKMVEKTFDIELNVDFAIEVEIGTIGDRFAKWDWTKKGLKECVVNALKTQKEILGTSRNVKRTVKKIYAAGMKHHAYLSKKFPLPIPPL